MQGQDMSPFGAGSGELETLDYQGPGSGQLRGGSLGLPRHPLPLPRTLPASCEALSCHPLLAGERAAASQAGAGMQRDLNS